MKDKVILVRRWAKTIFPNLYMCEKKKLSERIKNPNLEGSLSWEERLQMDINESLSIISWPEREDLVSSL